MSHIKRICEPVGFSAVPAVLRVLKMFLKISLIVANQQRLVSSHWVAGWNTFCVTALSNINILKYIQVHVCRKPQAWEEGKNHMQ